MSTILRPDILIESPTGVPVAIVEVRNRQGLAPEIAEDLYLTLTGYGYTVQTPFFLMVSQDVGYLWHRPDAAPDGATAQQLAMRPVIAHYLPDWPPDQRLGGPELQLVVGYWLNELTGGLAQVEEEPEHTLVTTGFLTAIRDARIRRQYTQ